MLDQSGNVVGVVTAKLDAVRVAETTGDIPQNVNFAINVGLVKAFLDARGVRYVSAASLKALPTEEVGERGRGFVAVVECWQ